MEKAARDWIKHAKNFFSLEAEDILGMNKDTIDKTIKLGRPEDRPGFTSEPLLIKKNRKQIELNFFILLQFLKYYFLF